MVFRTSLLISILLLSFFPLGVHSRYISGEEFISHLKEKGELGIFDEPTVDLFKSVCPSVQSPLGKELQTLCEVVTSSDTCKGVEPCDLLDCNNMSDSTDFDVIDFFSGCTVGLFDSAVELLSFIWDALKWVWNSVTHSSDTYQEASEYVESVKLYLTNEYDKAYEQASSPFRDIKAAKAVAGAIANMLFKNIQDYLYKEYQEFGCLNFRARMKTICKVAGEFIIPPVAALSLLKHGSKAAVQSGKLSDLIKGEKSQFALNKRKNLGESSLKRTLTQQEVEALEKAHLVGKGEVGKNGQPAGVGNYTLAQLRKKAEVLKRAGFSEQEIRKLMEDRVVGISSNGFARLFRRNRNHLDETGNPSYDRFREQFNKGQIEDAYISYRDPASRERLPGRIVYIDRNKGEVVIETPRGERYTIDGEDLKGIRVSETSRDGFVRLERERSPPGRDNVDRGGSVDDQPPAGYVRRVHRMEPTGITEYDDFRRAFNKGRIEGDSRYVSVPYGGERVVARVTGVSGDRLTVEVLEEGGRTRTVVVRGRDLESVRMSSRSKEFFSELNRRPSAPSVGGYDFSGSKVGDYRSRRGQIVRVDVESPRLERWMNEATDIIEERTGIRPNPGRQLSPEERNRIYRVWLNDVVKKVESKEPSRDYGDARDRIIGGGTNKGVGSLGEILDAEAAVCRELSMFGSVLLSEYGLKSKVVTGNVLTRTGKHGGHAWIQVYDDYGRPLEIIDSNNTRSIHPDFSDYDREVRGADIRFETPLMRVH